MFQLKRSVRVDETTRIPEELYKEFLRAAASVNDSGQHRLIQQRLVINTGSQAKRPEEVKHCDSVDDPELR